MNYPAFLKTDSHGKQVTHFVIQPIFFRNLHFFAAKDCNRSFSFFHFPTPGLCFLFYFLQGTLPTGCLNIEGAGFLFLIRVFVLSLSPFYTFFLFISRNSENNFLKGSDQKLYFLRFLGAIPVRSLCCSNRCFMFVLTLPRGTQISIHIDNQSRLMLKFATTHPAGATIARNRERF